jgi:hypothetical protein
MHVCQTAALTLALSFVSALAAAESPSAAGDRRVISLDGDWQIAEEKLDHVPTVFDRTAPVPGLVDMASPSFVEPGPRVKDRSARQQKDPRRNAFWYRRTFQLDGPVPEVATLKIGKAMFGTRVFLNGSAVGDHWPCFTPGLFDVRGTLKTGKNELLVRVGADRDAVASRAQSGYDGEKSRYIPGIYDSVELILSGTPRIVRVQAVPDIENKSVAIHAWVRHASVPAAATLHFTVREASSGRTVGEADCAIPAGGRGIEQQGQATIAVRHCRLWSPEDPFLYELETRGTADRLKTRFGMRSFRFDPATGRAMLNGRPYFMRGSNVTAYRFFEDSQRGDKPWREEWVRRLHRAFRDMHWNSLRYCIGFPPEAWYRIADEEGFLIQDEFPVWYCFPQPGDLDGDELAAEYREWMQERWNHPCVVLWDGCNETYAPETGKAIRKVRGLDFSNRPWDNGWGTPVEAGDSDEAHPYHFIFGPNQPFRMPALASDPGAKAGLLIAQPFAAEKERRKNAIVINEYGGLWLNRDGTPTTLSRPVYEYLLGPNSTTAQRRQLYARDMAAITEFFRSHRQAAAVLHFCALAYSRPDGQTSDHWADVERLDWDPAFHACVRDAFAPVGLMIDFWADECLGGTALKLPVAIINDLDSAWRGPVTLRLTRDGKTLIEKTQDGKVEALGRAVFSFQLNLPAVSGNYQVVAELPGVDGKPVHSLRDFEALSESDFRARCGIARGRPVKASSNLTKDGQTYSCELAVDGKPHTRWSSEFSDPQWLAVDLGKVVKLSRVELDWEAAFGKSYAIQVSTDGRTWTDVYHTDSGHGGTEVIRFTPANARWVRYYGAARGTPFGHSLRELRVFP